MEYILSPSPNICICRSYICIYIYVSCSCIHLNYSELCKIGKLKLGEVLDFKSLKRSLYSFSASRNEHSNLEREFKAYISPKMAALNVRTYMFGVWQYFRDKINAKVGVSTRLTIDHWRSQMSSSMAHLRFWSGSSSSPDGELALVALDVLSDTDITCLQEDKVESEEDSLNKVFEKNVFMSSRYYW